MTGVGILGRVAEHPGLAAAGALDEQGAAGLAGGLDHRRLGEGEAQEEGDGVDGPALTASQCARLVLS